MFLHSEDTTEIHVITLEESTNPPALSVAGEVLHDLTGVAVYHSSSKKKDLLFTAQQDTIAIYEASKDIDGSLQGTIQLTGHEDIEVFGLSFLQSSTKGFKEGALAFGIETDEREGYAVVSLDGVFSDLSI